MFERRATLQPQTQTSHVRSPVSAQRRRRKTTGRYVTFLSRFCHFHREKLERRFVFELQFSESSQLKLCFFNIELHYLHNHKLLFCKVLLSTFSAISLSRVEFCEEFSIECGRCSVSGAFFLERGVYGPPASASVSVLTLSLSEEKTNRLVCTSSVLIIYNILI